MSETEKQVLDVTMLGKFQICLRDGRPPAQVFTYPMIRNRSIRALHLLALLLYNRGRALSVTKLMEEIYGEDYEDKAYNNLRAVIFRVRRLLDEIGLCGGAHIISRKGLCWWEDGDILMVSDAERFWELAKKGLETSGEERERFLKEALKAYGGRLLPVLENEPWVIREDMKYSVMYRRCVDAYCRLMESLGRSSEGAACRMEAARKLPDEFWGYEGREKENRLAEPEELLGAKRALEHIQSGISIPYCLISCRIGLDGEGKTMERWGGGVKNKAREQFEQAALSQIRGYDLFSRFGGQEYRLLLVGAGERIGRQVMERIRGSLKGLLPGERWEFTYNIEETASLNKGGRKNSGKKAEKQPVSASELTDGITRLLLYFSGIR